MNWLLEPAVLVSLSTLTGVVLSELFRRFRSPQDTAHAEAQINKTESESMAVAASALTATFTALTTRMEGEIHDLRERMGRLEAELSASKDVIHLLSSERDRLELENKSLKARYDLLLDEYRQAQQTSGAGARVFGQADNEGDGDALSE